MYVVIAMDASPEKKLNGKGIIDWYTQNGYLNDFLEPFAVDGEGEMTYNKETRLYEIRFKPNESWPKTLVKQASEAHIALSNPDDDGNYPIDGHVVTAMIRSIDGHEFYDVQKTANKYGGITTKYIIKDEFWHALSS